MMRYKKHFLISLLLVVLYTMAIQAQVYYNSNAPTSTSARTITHKVKIGETAYSIANAYKTTVEDIYRLNPGTNKGVSAGQEINVPQTSADVASERYSTTPTPTTKHKIEAKETLFSVSQKYKITVSELLKANPGLNEGTFSIGREIDVPVLYSPSTSNAKPRYATIAHRIEKQETLYSISKKYDTTIDVIYNANPSLKQTGLQEGFTIHIPNVAVSGDSQAGNSSTQYLPQDGVARIALLLPFIEGSKSVSQDKITEYYEGFLLAVQKMKESGLNAEIYTFDIGNDKDTKRLESILGTNELNSLNLIIGGVSEKQVQLISRFSQRTGVKYVVPFSSKNTGVENNPNIYQVANAHSNLFPKVAKEFAKLFKDCNIIFLSEMGSDKNKADFIKELEKGLQASAVSYKVAPTTASITNDINSVVDNTRRNVIVPTSSSENSLERALEAVNVLTRRRVNVSLFGYPEWQTYINQTKELHDNNTYLYSMFYLNNRAAATQLFADKYTKWYNKNLVNSYPKFAHMGYDTGLVFLSALQKPGSDFVSRVNEMNATLQSALYFEPIKQNGGYINNGIYIINLKPNDVIEKLDISKR